MLVVSRKCNSLGFLRNSLPEVFCKQGALKNFAKFKGKHLCQSLFFLNKVPGSTCNFIKKRDSGTGVVL